MSILLVSLQIASAWGVFPARYLGEYTDQPQEITFTLRNTAFDEGYFQIEFAGDLKSYAEYNGPATIFYSPERYEGEIPITLTLPADGLVPGKNSLRVIMKQVPQPSDTNTVNSKLTLVSEVSINVPYDGEFVEASLYTTQASPREPTPFEISLLNKGDGPVAVYADMTVRGPTNDIVATWSTVPFILPFQGAEKIRTEWSGEKQAGSYSIEAIVHYGDDVQVLQKTFVLGSKEVVIREISAERFRLGEINQVYLTARSTWNDVLDDVFAEAFVIDEVGNVVQSFKTNPETFGPFQTQQLEAFWDTDNLQVGDYTLNIITEVADDSFQYSFPVTVGIDSIVMQGTGNVVATDDDGSSLNSIIVIVLIGVLVSNVILILYFRKKKR